MSLPVVTHVIELTTRVAAPPARCFDLSRSIEMHLHSTAATGEEVAHGRSTGLLEAGETIAWRARHFGVRQVLVVRISAFDPPRYFRDSQVRGAFRGFDHDHWFEPDGEGGTIIRERFAFEVPLGVLGRLVGRWIVAPYLRSFLAKRLESIRVAAEGEEWRRFLGETNR